MNNMFKSPAAGELHGFLQFKRSLGYGYMRAEFTLREFDRFLIEYAARNRGWRLDRAAIACGSANSALIVLSRPKTCGCVQELARARRG